MNMTLSTLITTEYFYDIIADEYNIDVENELFVVEYEVNSIERNKFNPYGEVISFHDFYEVNVIGVAYEDNDLYLSEQELENIGYELLDELLNNFYENKFV